MRKVFFSILAVLAIASVANAQEESKGPVLTGAKLIDHTFIGVNAGANTLFARESTLKEQENKYTLDLNVYVGKWFTPSLGLALGFQKVNVSEKFPAYFYSHSVLSTVPDDGNWKFGGNYLYGALMYNIGNGIWGYKDRTFNFIPYIHAGYMRMYDPEKGILDSSYADNEFAAGPAIMITAKLAKRLNLVLDVKDIVMSGRFHDYDDAGYVNNLTAGLGLQLCLGATTWTRPEKCVDNSGALADALAALAASQEALAKANADKDDLAKQLEECKNRPADIVYVKTSEGTALTLYYDINSTKLNSTELRHLDDYMNVVLKQEDSEKVFYLTGSADEGTGNLTINQRLVKGRAEGVKKILEDKYKVSADKIVLKEGKITNEHEDPKADRATIIEY